MAFPDRQCVAFVGDGGFSMLMAEFVNCVKVPVDHVVVGKADGTAHGGHVLDAKMWPTLELVLIKSPRTLARRSDPSTGLALIEIPARPAA